MKTNSYAALILSSLITLASPGRADDALVRREWQVDGITREAMVHIPAGTNSVPVLFAFHGHGGNMNQAARSFGFHTLWPEAIVVYPQGLNTPGRLTDPEGKKPGWQMDVGNQSDRDLKFFDAMLDSFKKESRADANRIYSTGHSNGGGFSYLLWAARYDILAAVAPSAAVLIPRLSAQLKPKPVLHVAGENDNLVKYEWQKLMIKSILKSNQCDADSGKPWDKDCTLYASKTNAPVVTFIHNGTHAFPKEAPALIVKFLKEQCKTNSP